MSFVSYEAGRVAGPPSRRSVLGGQAGFPRAWREGRDLAPEANVSHSASHYFGVRITPTTGSAPLCSLLSFNRQSAY